MINHVCFFTRPPLDYLNAHLTMPWNCYSLQHIVAYCRILHKSKNMQEQFPLILLLGPSAKCQFSTTSAPPSCCPGFQAFPPVSSCLWTTCNILQPVEINPRVSDPQATPGLFECPPHHAMELPIIAAYCSILQHSAPKQEQFSLTLFKRSAK